MRIFTVKTVPDVGECEFYNKKLATLRIYYYELRVLCISRDTKGIYDTKQFD